jgi:hypothetical protein
MTEGGSRSKTGFFDVLAKVGGLLGFLTLEDYLRFQALQEQEILARFDALTERMSERSAEFTDEEVAAEVEATRSEIAEGHR